VKCKKFNLTIKVLGTYSQLLGQKFEETRGVIFGSHCSFSDAVFSIFLCSSVVTWRLMIGMCVYMLAVAILLSY